jgi:hypothetical protein
MNRFLISVLNYIKNNPMAKKILFFVFFFFFRTVFDRYIRSSYFIYLYYLYTQSCVDIDNISTLYYLYYDMHDNAYHMPGIEFFDINHFNFYLYASYNEVDIYKIFPKSQFEYLYDGYFCSDSINSFFPVFHSMEHNLLFYNDIKLLLVNFGYIMDTHINTLKLYDFVERQYIYNEVGRIYLVYLIEHNELPGNLTSDQITELKYLFDTSYKYKFHMSFVNAVYKHYTKI